MVCGGVESETFRDDSPIVGAGEELLFDLGVPAATIQHGCVTLKGKSGSSS